MTLHKRAYGRPLCFLLLAVLFNPCGTVQRLGR